MAKVYYNRIRSGAITIDDVPAKQKDQVQALLDADTKEEVKNEQ